MPRLVFFLPLLLAAAASAQVAPHRDVRLGGRSVVGRWEAVEVVGDAVATADLRRGALTTTLVVNPTGHVILRGTDRREGRGAPSAFSGRIEGGRVQLRGLAGTAELALLGSQLHLVDPRGRQTVFVRAR